MIDRGGDFAVPDQETALRASDTLMRVGSDGDIDGAIRLFARSR
jgi:Trk K+ transport system NAD-binding subunit